ncbi:DUF934 domain-containing protein [Enhygromyxa salina]|uniref:Oxidoreductase probably involved in sulfite reduction n=1 Tax=Enhygromyxa salina TaxID=215803 RepID=A0A2S9YTV8_9BACT|nr:DUF934 domain-containing protein [Enhygromyxa salina]PRQ08523.1 hypothetical protein ENSA7_18090 [Enhygromyxa salina]
MANPSTPEAPELHPGARRIIRVGAAGKPEIVIDHWQRLVDGDPFPSLNALPVLVSLERAEQERPALEHRLGTWGIWLAGDADPEQVAARVLDRALVAIAVTKFTDGRHYSLARLLRERYGFRGELRAFGDVLPDQLSYMRRCGYTSFELARGKSLETGLRCLDAFSVSYQGNTEDPRPLYRRRG